MHFRGCYAMIAFVLIGTGAINAVASLGVDIVISPLASDHFDRSILQKVEFRLE